MDITVFMIMRKKTDQGFEIDIEAYRDLIAAINTDNVDATTDYSVLSL